MKTNNDGHVVPAHIEDQDLVAYLDGECDPEAQRATQAHLESCWFCRSRISHVERSIESFLQLRHDELLPGEVPPAGPSLDLFRSRLASHHPAPVNSFARQIIPNLRSYLNRVSDVLDFRAYSLRTQIIASRALAAVVMVSMVLGIVLLSGRDRTVSAAELLNRSIEAQAESLNQIDQPVLHQRIRIEASTSNAPALWDIWNDTANSRVVAKGGGVTDASGVVADLRSVLRNNNMNEHRALSAASFKAWSDSLVSKQESVDEGTASDGGRLLTIHTIPGGSVDTGRIASASLTLRESGYHPISLSISVASSNGSLEFKLVEQEFQIVSLKDVDPAIFADPTKVEVASTVGVPPLPEASREQPDTNTAELSVSNAKPDLPNATTADEVEVLDLLHQAGADITEQLTVTRAADGRLLIEGLVDTDKRKAEILAALAPANKNPAVRIRVQTIEEATLALKQQKAQSTPDTVELVQVEKGAIPADADLRRVFGGSGGDADAEIARFASRMVTRSQSALFQASALNRASGRFSSTQLAAMDKDARTKWLRILKNYAAAVRRETASLRADLQPIFGGFEAAGDESISSDAELVASARRLYEAASANDRAVRGAFVLSSAGGTASAIKSSEFRRTVALAESLAAAIERFK